MAGNAVIDTLILNITISQCLENNCQVIGALQSENCYFDVLNDSYDFPAYTSALYEVSYEVI